MRLEVLHVLLGLESIGLFSDLCLDHHFILQPQALKSPNFNLTESTNNKMV